VDVPADQHRDPGALSGPLAGVTFAASLIALNALSEARYPMPGAAPSAIRRFFSKEHKAARLGATAQLARRLPCPVCQVRDRPCRAREARLGSAPSGIGGRRRAGFDVAGGFGVDHGGIDDPPR